MYLIIMRIKIGENISMIAGYEVLNKPSVQTLVSSTIIQ